MTNWIEYPIIEYQFTKQEEIEMIRQHLLKMRRPVTLENAGVVLAMLDSEAPGEWTITQDDLVELWPEQIVMELAE